MGDGQHYVLGFAFFSGDVVLIHKLWGPEVVQGRKNGIGGKHEVNESMHNAMVREFKEETGAKTSEEQWDHYCTLYGQWGKVRCFRTTLSKRQFDSVFIGDRSLTDERVSVHPIDDLPADVVPNLRWLVPMALDPTVSNPTRVHVP